MSAPMPTCISSKDGQSSPHWLTKFAVYEAFARLKSRRRVSGLDIHREESIATTDRSPEERTFNSEMRSLLERTIDALSDDYRSVLIMRDIEGMSTSETADCLELSKENVKVRLFHARAEMLHQLFEYVGTASPKAFQFLGARCDRLVQVAQEGIKVR